MLEYKFQDAEFGSSSGSVSNTRTPGSALGGDLMNDRTPMALGRLPDLDQEETREWLESLDAAVAAVGPERARDLVLRLLDRAAEHNLNVPQVRDTDYLNTLTPAAQPAYPGDEAAEARIEA